METEQDDENLSLFNSTIRPCGFGNSLSTRLMRQRPYIYGTPLLNMLIKSSLSILEPSMSPNITRMREMDEDLGYVETEENKVIRIETRDIGTQYDLNDFTEEIVDEQEDEVWFFVKDKSV